MKAAVPENIQILTLEPWKGTSFLLRLEHILEKVDDPSAAQPIVVNLQVSFVVHNYIQAMEFYADLFTLI